MRYMVDIAYTGYVSQIVEANSEEEAIELVEHSGTTGIGNFERWPECDMVEEEPESKGETE